MYTRDIVLYVIVECLFISFSLSSLLLLSLLRWLQPVEGKFSIFSVSVLEDEL